MTHKSLLQKNHAVFIDCHAQMLDECALAIGTLYTGYI